MSIESVVIDFLQNPTQDQDGNSIRQAARQGLAAAVGQRIYSGFVPQPSELIALDLNRYANRRFQDIPGESPMRFSMLDITIWGRGPGIDKQLLEVADNLRLSLTDYSGIMGGLRIFEIGLDVDGMLTAISPDDSSDNRTRAYSSSFDICHEQTVNYPNAVLGE